MLQRQQPNWSWLARNPEPSPSLFFGITALINPHDKQIFPINITITILINNNRMICSPQVPWGET